MEKGQMIRSGTIADISAAETTLRVVRLSKVGQGSPALTTILQGNPQVSGLLVQGAQAVFKFSGSDEELAGILAGLVSAGVKVVSFGEVKQTVEDLYLKLSHNEVM
jgi:ABC-2 type transport system ATP-binding protein